MAATPYRALILDDEESIRAILEMTLEPPDWQLELAASVTDARRLLAEKSFDLIVTDKNLPDGDGVEFVRHVRDVHPDVACVMITAFPSAATAVETLNLDIDDYLVKPFDIVALAAKLRTIIERRQSTRRSRGLHEATAAFQRVREHLQRAKSLPRGDGLRVVQVLSDAGDRAHLEPLLRDAGHDVSTFVTSASALEATREPADAIVVDAAVRGPDVFGLLEALRSKGGDPVVVVIASAPELETVTRLMKIGGAQLIQKPIGRDELGARVGALVETARRRRGKGDAS